MPVNHAYHFTPATGAVTQDGTAQTNATNVNFKVLVNPVTSALDSGASTGAASVDQVCEFWYDIIDTASEAAVILQGGPSATNPLESGLGIAANGVRIPRKRIKANQGDTVELIVGGSNITFTVGATVTAVDPTNTKLFSDSSTGTPSLSV
jgi:hypothetical protein